MAVLHDVLPEAVFDCWWNFVQLCELLSRWELDSDDVQSVGELSLSFYEHYRDFYYKMRSDRIHFCKFVNHLLLHLDESIKQCGPLSLLAQWNMETFIGDTNRRWNAKHLFAESVAENIKFQAASRQYAIMRGIKVPLLDFDSFDEDEESENSKIPPYTSGEEELEGFSFRHPRTTTDIEELSAKIEVDVASLLRSFYMRQGWTESEVTLEVLPTDPLMVWARMNDTKTESLRQYTYKGEISYTRRAKKVLLHRWILHKRPRGYKSIV